MSLMSRLTGRSPVQNVPPTHAPFILIAERFVSPFANLTFVDMPDDVRHAAPGKPLDAVIIDESGVLCRRAAVSAPPAGRAGNRLEFATLPIQPGARLWLFVINAEHLAGAVTAGLVDELLQHGQQLRDRPPIVLPFDAPQHEAPTGKAPHRDTPGRRADTPQRAAQADPGRSAAAAHGGPGQQDLAPAAIPPLPVAAGNRQVSFAMLSETPPADLLPPLDQPELDPTKLSPEQRAWRENGVLELRQFIPDAILDRYIRVREKVAAPNGWGSPTPYMQVEELRHVCLYPPLRRVMRELIGEEMLLHLNLTGWVTTQRDWHQDDYLNPPFINSWYVAVWIALERIDPDSGPFEYVPGSHRWPLLRGDKVRSFMSEAELAASILPNGLDNWPKTSEYFVVPAIDAEIARRQVPPRRFLADKGDVLIWHGRLMHRGTRAARPEIPRRALIAHYSGVNHRPDMQQRQTDAEGGVWAMFDRPLF
jgi:hypothetical protein